jgi:hypothetical protein
MNTKTRSFRVCGGIFHEGEVRCLSSGRLGESAFVVSGGNQDGSFGLIRPPASGHGHESRCSLAGGRLKLEIPALFPPIETTQAPTPRALIDG